MACILVNGDVPPLRTTLRRFRETAGYAVAEAEDGLRGVTFRGRRSLNS